MNKIKAWLIEKDVVGKSNTTVELLLLFFAVCYLFGSMWYLTWAIMRALG